MRTNRRRTEPLPGESWRDRSRREAAERARLLRESKRAAREFKPADFGELPV